MKLLISLSNLKDADAILADAKAHGKVKLYKKVGKVHARPAIAGEKIDTVIDGKLETTNTAKSGDFVVTGPKSEEYIISGDKFHARYAKTNELFIWEPTGTCWAYQLPSNTQPFKFKASWGEEMIANPGDWLCSIEKDLRQAYRIEKAVFKETYVLK